MSGTFRAWQADMCGRIPYDSNMALHKIKLFNVEYAQWGVVSDALQPAIEKAKAWLKSVGAAGLHLEILELDTKLTLNVEINTSGNVAFFVLQGDRCIWSSLDWDVGKIDSDNYHYAVSRQSNIHKYRNICWLVLLYKWDKFKKAVSEEMMEQHGELLDILSMTEHFDDGKKDGVANGEDDA